MARALLPSWRFFDEIDPAPKLFYRTAEASTPLDAWLPLTFRPARRWSGLVFNPEGNLALARHALLEQLLDDIAEPEVSDASAVEGLTSYALVTQLVRERLRRPAPSARAVFAPEREPAITPLGARFQFKITLAEAYPASASAAEDVLVSGIHEV